MSVHQAAVLLVSWLVLIASTADADRTTTPGAKGWGVAEAVCGLIDASCVFPDDKMLTRRIAYVESEDGIDQWTFRSGYYGGIWQMDEAMFNETKLAGTQLNAQRLAIRANFSFDWMTVTWQDLTKPLHSALAARLFIHNRPPPATIPRDLNGQATFYVTHYRPGTNEEFFKRDVNQLEDKSFCKNSNGADVMFVLDGSGSIGTSNFQLIRNFVKRAIGDFDVGLEPNQTRIGVIQFGTDVVHEFNLTTYMNKADMIAAVDRIPYRSGNTYTNLALDAMRLKSFGDEGGARPIQNGHPRIGIVVTDGMSTNPTLTIAAAERVHLADITMLSVGVGSAVMAELRVIASDPVCLNVIMLAGFTEFDSLQDIIEKRTCEAPMIISIEQGSNSSLPPGRDMNCKIKVSPPTTVMLANNGTAEKGLTIRVWTLTGSATFYLSKVTYPSADFYDQLVRSVPGEPGVVYIESGNAEGVVYANIEGSTTHTTNFGLEAVSGDRDHCKTNPCPVGARCVDTGDSYECKSGSGALRTSALLCTLATALSTQLLLLGRH